MTKINDGGPAFPVTPTDRSGQCAPTQYSMSLRDYFASKAMQGMLACPVQPQCDADMYARDAFWIADAMLRARENNT